MAEIGAGGGSGYPGALDTNSTLEVDSSTLARADVPNDLAAALIAVQTELGTDPAGTKTDVKTFLQLEHQTDGTHWRRSAKTGDYTVLTSDNMTLFEASTSGGDITFTLPSLSSATDSFLLAFKKTHSSNSMILDGNSSENIDGATTRTYTADDSHVIIWSNGTDNWIVVSDSSFDLVNDASPQLGGNLDVNGNSVVTASNANLSITPNGSGDLILDGLKWPQADGTANYVLKTNGSAQLSWTTNSADKIKQIVKTESTTQSSGTTQLPTRDTSIPQITEGDEYMTRTITPASSSNRLLIQVSIHYGMGTDGREVGAAIFQDTTANALASVSEYATSAGDMHELFFMLEMEAGTTSETTFKVRAGWGYQSTTFYFNRDKNVNTMGGVLKSYIIITEYET
jgi:hypothetical protein